MGLRRPGLRVKSCYDDDDDDDDGGGDAQVQLRDPLRKSIKNKRDLIKR